jgi:putative transcriptional regulator
MEDANNIFKIDPGNIKPVQGRVLISEPFTNDYYFKRSVVLLIEHGDEGTFGLIINKPLQLKLEEVSKEFSNFEAGIYLGGPVKTENIYFIHRLGNRITGSLEIKEGIYWGGDVEQVKEMIDNKQISASDIRFFIGYSGWIPKQLENELENNAWVVSTINSSEIINADIETLWDRLVKKLGEKYKLWTTFPTNPSVN